MCVCALTACGVFFLTNGWTFSFEDVAVETLALQEFLVAVARDPHQRAGAVESTYVYVQRPHVITYHIVVNWKLELKLKTRGV